MLKNLLEMVSILVLYTSILMIMIYNKNLIFIFICLELLNLGVLLHFMNLMSFSFFYVFYIIIIQVCDSLLLMLLYIKNMTMWESFSTWMIS